MKFEALEIQNFLSIATATIYLNDRGLTVIQGENLDNTSAHSNGAGKSTIPDALFWCLYGETARGGKGDAIINDKAGKDCFVSVTILDAGEKYLITRYRKHKTGKNSLTLERHDAAKGWMSLTLGTDKLTQDEVNKLIGSSQEVFTSAVYAGQEQMPNLPAMTDKQLKTLIEEASGSLVLERCHTEALSRFRAASAERAKCDMETDKAETALEDIRAQLVATRSLEVDWLATRDADVLGKRTALLASGELLKVQIAEIKTLKAATVPKIARVDEIKAKIDGMASERDTERALVQAAKDALIEVTNVSASGKALLRDIAANKQKLADIEKMVGTPCDSCGKPYAEHDIESVRELTKAKAVPLVKSLAEIEAQEIVAKENLQKAQDNLAAFLKTVSDPSALMTERSALEAELAQFNVKYNAATNAKTMYQRDSEALKAREAEVCPYKAMIDTLLANEAKTGAEFKLCNDKLHDAIAQEARCESVVKVFSPGGVRARILDDVTPFLNEQTEKYLATLSDGNSSAIWTTLVRTAKGELREKFSIEVEDKAGGKSFTLLSGGEKRKVRIAAALALQDLVARRASKPIELFIGDEIDDALDEAGLERLTQILTEKAKDRGSVFVISHNDLSDWISQILFVTRENGVSVVEEVEV